MVLERNKCLVFVLCSGKVCGMETTTKPEVTHVAPQGWAYLYTLGLYPVYSSVWKTQGMVADSKRDYWSTYYKGQGAKAVEFRAECSPGGLTQEQVASLS